MPIRTRYLVSFSAWLTLFTLYVLRGNISVAIISMASSQATNSTAPFRWTDQEQGYILSGFFYGYFATHMLGSLLSAKIGVRITMAISLAGAGLFTFLMIPMSYSGLLGAILSRVIVGLFSGPLYPCIHELMGHWAPLPERTLMIVVTHSGNIMGLIANFGLGGVIVNSGPDGWQYFFYFSGSLAILCLVVWLACAFDEPWRHPYIGDKEKDYIIKSLHPHGIPSKEHSFKEIPFKNIFSCYHVYLIGIAHFGNNFIIYAFLTGHAKFLKDYFHVAVQKASILSIIPFVGNFISQIIVSIVTDMCIRKYPHKKLTFFRKINAVIGFLGAAIILIPTGYVAKSGGIPAVVSSLCISMAFIGFNQSSFFTSMVDIAPDYAGIIMGICNTMGSMAGIISPSVTGSLIQSYGKEQGWTYLFIISGIVSVVTGFIWIIFGTSERQKWAEGVKHNIEGHAALNSDLPHSDNSHQSLAAAPGNEQIKNNLPQENSETHTEVS